MPRDARFPLNNLTVKGVEGYESRSRIVLADANHVVTIERRQGLPAKLRKLQAGDVVDLAIQFDEGGG